MMKYDANCEEEENPYGALFVRITADTFGDTIIITRDINNNTAVQGARWCACGVAVNLI